jgi:hypothetical protein
MEINSTNLPYKRMKIFFFICILISLTSTELLGQMIKVPLEQLSKSSHTIIKGTVLNKRSEFESEGDYIITYITFNISETLKGVSKDTITVVIPGGVIGNLGMSVSQTPKFQIGEEVVIFVSNDYKGRKTVTDWQQGKFTIKNNQVKYESNDVEAGEFIKSLKNFINQKETGEIKFNINDRSVKSKMGINSVLAIPVITSISPNSGPCVKAICN